MNVCNIQYDIFQFRNWQVFLQLIIIEMKQYASCLPLPMDTCYPNQTEPESNAKDLRNLRLNTHTHTETAIRKQTEFAVNVIVVSAPFNPAVQNMANSKK